MKKPIRVILLAAVLLALMSVAAFAEDAATYMTVTPNGADLTPSGGLVNMYYNSARSGNYYLVFLVKGTGTTPTVDNVVYIDQVTAEGSSVSFDLYPSSWSNGTYTVLLASNDGTSVQSVGTIAYDAPYTLGDVNSDGKINASDATEVLMHAVKKKTLTGDTFSAADVTKNNIVDAADATRILMYSVKKITEF